MQWVWSLFPCPDPEGDVVSLQRDLLQKLSFLWFFLFFPFFVLASCKIIKLHPWDWGMHMTSSQKKFSAKSLRRSNNLLPACFEVILCHAFWQADPRFFGSCSLPCRSFVTTWCWSWVCLVLCLKKACGPTVKFYTFHLALHREIWLLVSLKEDRGSCICCKVSHRHFFRSNCIEKIAKCTIFGCKAAVLCGKL